MIKNSPPPALIWLEAKEKVRDRNYVSMFPELTYEMAVAIRSMGLEKLIEILEKDD